METVTITFKDSTAVEAEVNANTYITDEKPDFPQDLSEVQIDGKDGAEILHNAEVVECYAMDERYWFGFREISEAELNAARTDAQVMWTALMTDTLLEED